jgi:scyllo-inositol 2-dehydrogenase (NADP+)
MATHPFELAIVGFGGMGSHHQRVIDTVDGLTVRGIYDILPEVREQARQDGIFAYDSLQEVLNDPKVDIVLVATPNHFHQEISIAALDAGKNVICEKPVTLNAAELQAVLAAAARSGKLFTVHQNRRWDEDYRMARRLIEQQAIGTVYHIERRVIGSRGIPGDWRKIKACGGGMLLDWGVHLLDQLLDFIKQPIESVYCEFSYVLGNDCDDGCRILLRFAGGLTVLVEVQTWNFITLPNWYINGTGGTAVLDRFGEEGWIERLVDFDTTDAVPIVTAAGLTKTMAPRPDASVVREEIAKITTDVREFYVNVMDAIEGRCAPIVKTDEILRVMRLVDACFQSAEQGCSVACAI